MEELVVSKKDYLSKPSPMQSCAAHPECPSSLCWAAQNPWLKDHISWLIATGCSCWIPAIATPSCSCLFPERSKTLCEHPFYLTAEIMKKIILSQETPIAKGATLLMGRVWTYFIQSMYQRSIQSCTTKDSQHLKGHKIIPILSFFTVLPLIHSI